MVSIVGNGIFYELKNYVTFVEINGTEKKKLESTCIHRLSNFDAIKVVFYNFADIDFARNLSQSFILFPF